MSKTAQRKAQAYREGLQHGVWGSGIAYIRHPFMAEYRKGYVDGRARAKYMHQAKRDKELRKTWTVRLLAWIARRFA